MKKVFIIILLTGLISSSSFGQYSTVIANPSYKYVAAPGFVNITELNGALGLPDCDPESSKYYFGVTNLFGYQISRNFLGGLGVGYFYFEGGQLLPVYLEYKYSVYLKSFTPYIYADGGLLIDPADFRNESKIYLNPGLGVSRSISSKFEINISGGYMIQTRTSLSRVTFFNFKVGVIYRNNSFRMFKSSKAKQ